MLVLGCIDADVLQLEAQFAGVVKLYKSISTCISFQRGKAEYPKKRGKKERGKHDQKASNDIADWKWEKRRVTTRRVATREEL